jgi:hypothetical protein
MTDLMQVSATVPVQDPQWFSDLEMIEDCGLDEGM